MAGATTMIPSLPVPARADLIVQVWASPTARVDFAVLLNRARGEQAWRARVEARVHFLADLTVIGLALDEFTLPSRLARGQAARAVGARLVADLAQDPSVVSTLLLAAMRRALRGAAAATN